MIDVHERGRRVTGILLLILSSSLFAVVDGLSKLLAETQSVGQIVWARYTLAIPVLLATTRPAHLAGLFRTVRPGLQILRGLAPLGISATMVLAVHYLPLAEATVILFAGPFLIVALSGPVLGEKVPAASWIGVTVGFAAVVIVARPGFGALSHYAIYPAVAAVLFAGYQLLSRKLGALGEKPNTTLAWTLVIGAVGALPFAIIDWRPADTRAWLLMVALGLAFGGAQSLLIRAYTLATAGLLAPFSYAQLIAAVLLGMAVFGDVPDWLTFAGIGLIVVAGAVVARGRGR